MRGQPFLCFALKGTSRVALLSVCLVYIIICSSIVVVGSIHMNLVLLSIFINALFNLPHSVVFLECLEIYPFVLTQYFLWPQRRDSLSPYSFLVIPLLLLVDLAEV